MILVTAFKPFNNMLSNSSEYALNKANLGSDVVKAFLSVSLDETKKEFEELIKKYNPEIIIHFGQSGKTKEIAIEKRAINLLNFEIKDNSGNMPKNKKIIDDENEYLYSTADTKALSSYLNNAHILSNESLDAGKFICNYLYYLSLSKGFKSVFIHLPYLKGQTEKGNCYTVDEISLIKTIELSVNFLKGESAWK